jgi:hypothetical protein
MIYIFSFNLLFPNYTRILIYWFVLRNKLILFLKNIKNIKNILNISLTKSDNHVKFKQIESSGHAKSKTLGSSDHARFKNRESRAKHGCQPMPGSNTKHAGPRLLGLALLPDPRSLSLVWYPEPSSLDLTCLLDSSKQQTNKGELCTLVAMREKRKKKSKQSITGAIQL